MPHSKYHRLALGVLVGVIVITTPVLILIALNAPPVGIEVKLTLLNNAGVMIEAKGVRIYIDPVNIPSNYSELPADAVLITHQHSDHYRVLDIADVEINDTVYVFPKNMTEAIARHGGIGVNPGDSLQIKGISVTAFYMYTPPPPGFVSSHPREANLTSYIINIDGFVVFHGGDAKYMEEYEQLVGQVDVAFLGIYWDERMGPIEVDMTPVVDVVELVQPEYLIPMHYTYLRSTNSTFMTVYAPQVESAGCAVLNLAYFHSCSFILEADDSYHLA